MSTKAARRDYLQAVAEFQQGVQQFADGMGRILHSSTPAGTPHDDEQAAAITQRLGPRKPAKRAPRSHRLIEDAKKA